jgi:hypothetical protein
MAHKPWLLYELEIQHKCRTASSHMDTFNEDNLWRLADRLRNLAQGFAPFLTGALREAISITTSSRSDHSQRTALGQALRPEARFAGKTHPPRDSADIHAAAHYATYQELGTSKHPAHPYLVRALMQINRELSHTFEVSWETYLRAVPYETEKLT